MISCLVHYTPRVLVQRSANTPEREQYLANYRKRLAFSHLLGGASYISGLASVQNFAPQPLGARVATGIGALASAALWRYCGNTAVDLAKKAFIALSEKNEDEALTSIQQGADLDYTRDGTVYTIDVFPLIKIGLIPKTGSQSLLEAAIFQDCFRVVQYLIDDLGMSVNDVSLGHCKSLELVQYLLDKDVPVNTSDVTYSPLYFYIWSWFRSKGSEKEIFKQIIDLLISKGAHFNTTYEKSRLKGVLNSDSSDEWLQTLSKLQCRVQWSPSPAG